MRDVEHLKFYSGIGFIDKEILCLLTLHHQIINSSSLKQLSKRLSRFRGKNHRLAELDLSGFNKYSQAF